jgi:hypothetical protein
VVSINQSHDTHFYPTFPPLVPHFDTLRHYRNAPAYLQVGKQRLFHKFLLIHKYLDHFKGQKKIPHRRIHSEQQRTEQHKAATFGIKVV